MEALKHQTVNAAGLLSCNVPSEPRPSAGGAQSRHVGRENRCGERWRAAYSDLDMKKEWELGSHGGGSACTDASGQSMSGAHQSLSAFRWETHTTVHLVVYCWDVHWIVASNSVGDVNMDEQVEKHFLNSFFSFLGFTCLHMLTFLRLHVVWGAKAIYPEMTQNK